MADKDEDRTLKLLAELLDNREKAEKIGKQLGQSATAAIELLESLHHAQRGTCRICGRESSPKLGVHVTFIAWTCIVFAIFVAVSVIWRVPSASLLQPNLIWLVLVVLAIPLAFVIALMRVATSSADA